MNSLLSASVICVRLSEKQADDAVSSERNCLSKRDLKKLEQWHVTVMLTAVDAALHDYF